jgi:Cu/Ag efflux protein CusF
MLRRMFLGILSIVLPAMLLAHGGFEHVTGFVRAIDANSVTVETVKHEIVTVLLTPQTDVLKSGVKAKMADLKIGDRVAIHAMKNKDGKLEAHEVSFGPVKASAEPGKP